MLVPMESTVAIALLALTCAIVAAQDIGCEVDGPPGRCWEVEWSCRRFVYETNTYCSVGKDVPTEANKDVHRPCTDESLSCEKEWLVDNVSDSARCKPEVTVSRFYHFSYLFYIAEVYWKYSVCETQSCTCGYVINLVGVQVSIQSDHFVQCSDTGNGGSTTGDCCYCQSTNYSAGIEGQKFNITIQYGRNSDSEASETVRVLSYPLHNGVTELDSYYTQYDFDRLVNCYDERLPVDLVRCGVPQYGKPNHASAANYSVEENGADMNVTLTWEPPFYRSGYPEPTEYYLKLREVNSTSSSTYFRVANTTQVVLTHLNASKTYDVELQVYDVCSGSNNRDDDDSGGCGEVSEIKIMYMDSEHKGNTTASSESDVGIIVGTCIAVAFPIILVTIVMVAVCIVVVWKKHSSDQSDRVQGEPVKLPFLHSSGHLPYVSPTEPFPNSMPPPYPYTGELGASTLVGKPSSVLVVYSDRTQETEKAQILQTIGALRQECGILSICHECFLRGDSVVFQVADNLVEADAVLCICNPEFYSDWNSERPPPVINALKHMIGAEISSGRNLSKYATVFMYEQDKEHCVPYHFLQTTRQFLISDLDDIVGFIRDIPTIEIPSVKQEGI